jgi:hypothetical protein
MQSIDFHWPSFNLVPEILNRLSIYMENQANDLICLSIVEEIEKS